MARDKGKIPTDGDSIGRKLLALVSLRLSCMGSTVLRTSYGGPSAHTRRHLP